MDKVTNNTKVARSLWNCANDILAHRTGTKFEDLSFIDSNTGKRKTNKDYNVENHAKPNKPMKKMLKEAKSYTVIGVHNHPSSGVPSLPDIRACIERKYKFGVVVCHNGTIYKYSVNDKKYNEPIAISALAELEKNGYNDSAKSMFKDAGIKMEVL